MWGFEVFFFKLSFFPPFDLILFYQMQTPYSHHRKVRVLVHLLLCLNSLKWKQTSEWFSFFTLGEMHDIFVGLMGRRNSEQGEFGYSRQKSRRISSLFLSAFRSMVFYGSELQYFITSALTDNGPWRREYPERRGIFLNKCRLRWVHLLFSVGKDNTSPRGEIKLNDRTISDKSWMQCRLMSSYTSFHSWKTDLQSAWVCDMADLSVRTTLKPMMCSFPGFFRGCKHFTPKQLSHWATLTRWKRTQTLS